VIGTDQVHAVVADALGCEVRRVERIQGSVANQDFLINCADQELVLKAGPGTEIAAETWACERLVDIGVPVPHVIVSEPDSSQLGLPFLIATFVAGEPSSDVDVVRQVGIWIRRIHEERLTGWGSVTVDPQPAGPPTVRGCYPSWREAMEADLAGLPELVAAGLLQEGLADAARTLVSVEDVLYYDGPGVLLHNDLKAAHLLAVHDHGRQRLSAIIDWGDASIGDPRAEIARLSMSGPAMTAAFLDGYGMPLIDELADRLTRYRILWNVKALSYEYRAGGDWFDAYRNHIEEDTARLLA
jgi:aminoglycoside phosphotransferase (APT) family kinase protein